MDAGGEAISLTVDVSRAVDVKGMLDETLDRYGGLDVAVNNAGISGAMAPTAEYMIEEWDRVTSVNLRGVFLCMKYELLAMLQNGGGSIVNVASILGQVGFANAPAYSAAKHGVVGLTKTAALEYSGHGIRINAVCPAFIETPMLEDAGITADSEMRKHVTNLHPIGRMGTSEEVAEAILWLASPGASFVAGEALLVDGGYVAR